VLSLVTYNGDILVLFIHSRAVEFMCWRTH